MSRVGWYELPSGVRFHGTIPDREGVKVLDAPPLSTDELDDLVAATAAKVRDAIAVGDEKESDRLILEAVNLGVSPTVLVVAVGDEAVEPVERGPAVDPEVPVLDLPKDPAEVADGPGDDDAAVADDQVDGDVKRQGAQRKPRGKRT